MNELRRTPQIRKTSTAGQGRIVLAAALCAALLAGAGIFHAYAKVSVVRAGYELGQVEAKYRELLREHEHLKLEKATLRSAPRLDSIARARLGLMPPTAGQIIAVRPAAPKPAPTKVAAVTPAELERNP